MSTTPITLKERVYPTITTVTYAIDKCQKELAEAKQEESQLIAKRIQLLRRPATQENEELLNGLEAKVLVIVAKKERLQNRITALKDSLPHVKKEATQNEKDLNAARKKVGEIRSEISKIDSELTESLKVPLELLHRRKKVIQQLSRTSDKIRSLTADLKWHPVGHQLIPAEARIMDELRKGL